MANPDKIPPHEMAPLLGVGSLTRHVLLCLGPACAEPEAGQRTWDYLKKRLAQLKLAGRGRPCYRTKCDCLRICIDGPICVVYPEGAWYRNVTPENVERIIQEHLIEGSVVDELCFARNPLHTPAGEAVP